MVLVVEQTVDRVLGVNWLSPAAQTALIIHETVSSPPPYLYVDAMVGLASTRTMPVSSHLARVSSQRLLRNIKPKGSL